MMSLPAIGNRMMSLAREVADSVRQHDEGEPRRDRIARLRAISLKGSRCSVLKNSNDFQEAHVADIKARLEAASLLLEDDMDEKDRLKVQADVRALRFVLGLNEANIAAGKRADADLLELETDSLEEEQ